MVYSHLNLSRPTIATTSLPGTPANTPNTANTQSSGNNRSAVWTLTDGDEAGSKDEEEKDSTRHHHYELQQQQSQERQSDEHHHHHYHHHHWYHYQQPQQEEERSSPQPQPQPSQQQQQQVQPQTQGHARSQSSHSAGTQKKKKKAPARRSTDPYNAPFSSFGDLLTYPLIETNDLPTPKAPKAHSSKSAAPTSVPIPPAPAATGAKLAAAPSTPPPTTKTQPHVTTTATAPTNLEATTTANADAARRQPDHNNILPHSTHRQRPHPLHQQTVSDSSDASAGRGAGPTDPLPYRQYSVHVEAAPQQPSKPRRGLLGLAAREDRESREHKENRDDNNNNRDSRDDKGAAAVAPGNTNTTNKLRKGVPSVLRPASHAAAVDAEAREAAAIDPRMLHDYHLFYRAHPQQPRRPPTQEPQPAPVSSSSSSSTSSVVPQRAAPTFQRASTEPQLPSHPHGYGERSSQVPPELYYVQHQQQQHQPPLPRPQAQTPPPHQQQHQRLQSHPQIVHPQPRHPDQDRPLPPLPSEPDQPGGGAQHYHQHNQSTPVATRHPSPHLELPQQIPRPLSQQSSGRPSPLGSPVPHLAESTPQKPVHRHPLQSSFALIPPPSLLPGGMPSDRQTGLRQQQQPQQQPMDQHGQNRDTPPQGGHQQQQAQPPSAPPQQSSFKGEGSQGQTTPQPGKQAKDEPSDPDVKALTHKHEELQAKYIKVKRYYFEKEAQVQELQNTVAHQRMSAVRTVLDDNAYTTRFNRLDGAINNLAFNIRKDWKHVPAWLNGVMSDDAHTTGTKEMTAAGRACITRLLVDEIFDRYFHPCLEPNLSRNLKAIEHNVRGMGKAVTDEEKDNQLDRLSFWRRTTLDGLEDALQSKTADEHRAQLTRALVEKLTASLEMDLKDPAPPGLENGVEMIVELAVGLAANIPLESRDVRVEYFLPGMPLLETHMKVETTLPPLPFSVFEGRQLSDGSDQQGPSSSQVDLVSSDHAGHNQENGKDTSSSSSTTNSQQHQTIREGRRRTVFGNLIRQPRPQQPSGGGNQGASPQPLSDGQRPKSASHRDEDGGKDDGGRLRFAAFVAVEVRSKGASNVLVKAPVYPFAKIS